MHDGHDTGSGAHRHEHTHKHSHQHEHNNDHDHAHSHDHDHAHSHSHDEGAPEPKEPIVALLSYMVKHNADHGQELVQMAEKLEGMDLKEAAAEIRKGVSLYSEGNKVLGEALVSVKDKLQGGK